LLHQNDYSIKGLSVDGSQEEDLLSCDGIIDMSPQAKCPELLRLYYGFNRYLCYRNGYAAHMYPRLKAEEKHFVVPSDQNKRLFKGAGYDSDTAYYGIDDSFYNPAIFGDEEFWNYYDRKGLTKKEYWLFPHRPTPEKGVYTLVKLAKEFPDEIFVVSAQTPLPEHQLSLMNFLRMVNASGVSDNVVFVATPENPRHHFYKRELYRNAKGLLSPFDATNYYEGFGLSNAEAVSTGCPLLITDSESSRELWIEKKDALYADGYMSFKYAIEHWNSYTFNPENKFSLQHYAERYLELLKKY
jgi:glycosyltransferase involved in cell wall biosynthesis